MARKASSKPGACSRRPLRKRLTPFSAFICEQLGQANNRVSDGHSGTGL
jgi:hypothetical protein